VFDSRNFVGTRRYDPGMSKIPPGVNPNTVNTVVCTLLRGGKPMSVADLHHEGGTQFRTTYAALEWLESEGHVAQDDRHRYRFTSAGLVEYFGVGGVNALMIRGALPALARSSRE